MLFPMHTVTADVLMKMTEVEPHEKLKAGPVQTRNLWSGVRIWELM